MKIQRAKLIKRALPQYAKILQRMLQHVEADGECWVWIRGRSNGYGVMYVKELNRNFLTHRLMLIALGIPIGNKLVCHKCDNPPCCRPNHLFVGTQKDNITDCIAKGRNSPPPRTDWITSKRSKPHHWQRLTHEQARTIKRRAKAGELQKIIAAELGVSPKTVSKIKLGQRWPEL